MKTALQHGEQRVREKRIGSENVADLVEEYLAEVGDLLRA